MNPFKDPRFLKRLRLYLFGFVIGILLVVVLFRDRFPQAVDEEKLRDSFRKDSLVLSSEVEGTIDSLGLSPKAFRDSLLKGDFLLPGGGSKDHSRFEVRIDEPAMIVRMKVLDEARTRAEGVRGSEE